MKYMLIQTAIGDYRQSVISQLEEAFDEELRVCCGDVYFDETTRTRIEFNGRIKHLKNIYLFKRRLLFQIGCFFDALIVDNVILELNPRIVNTWLIAIIRRFLGKPVVMWGHAWPRKGKGASTDKIRSILRSLASQIIVYTESQKRELLEHEHKLTIVVAPNSLYQKNEMFFQGETKRVDFIYVGRLVRSKKIVLLLKAFLEFKKNTSNTSSNLIVVGDGPEKQSCLEILNQEPEFRSSVIFKGHVSDTEELRSLYSTSIASISPGYVGLSITQSFAFGVPMIISRYENHSPEIEAAIKGENSFFFNTDDVADLAGHIEKSYHFRKNLHARGDDIVARCRETYSSNVMAERISLALRLATEFSPDNKKGFLSRFVRYYIRFARVVFLKFFSKVQVGSNVSFGKGAKIQSPDYFKVGNNFSVGADLFVQTNLKAGNDCLISSKVSFVGNDHDFSSITKSLYWSGKNRPSTVILKGNNFIGYGATLVGNVTVGTGAVIGAGAVVVSDVEENSVVLGIPAKHIKYRDM